MNTSIHKKFLFYLFILGLFSFSLSFHSCSSDDNVFIVPAEEEEVAETEEKYEIHFIDVGQGDAIYISTPDKNLLVDAGRRNTGVVEYLQALEVESIDYVIATHPHADHIGGLISVFHNFEVGEIFDPGVTHTTATFNEYLSTIDFFDIPFTIGRDGMERELSENASFLIIHPNEPDPGHLNNSSLVAIVTLNQIKVMLTGDLEREREHKLAQKFESDFLQSHILKVGHHGSHTSSTEMFLDAVQPEVSVIMCGVDNPYGHPHNVAMERLQQTQTSIYRTDLHGHIVIETDGTEYVITTEK